MKATGIVRKLDELGRVVVPIELRRSMDLKDGDPLEIFTDRDGQIILRKYAPGCYVCGGTEDLRTHSNGRISMCLKCIGDLTSPDGQAWKETST